MPTTSINPVDYGFINLISGVYGSGEGLILASVTSSQASNENRAFWFYDTSASALAAASPSIPSDAIIDSVVWNSYIDSFSYGIIDAINRAFQMYGSNSGGAGGTIDAGDWGLVNTSLYSTDTLSVGTMSVNVTNNASSSPFGINRTGYTNYSWRTQIFEGGFPGAWQLTSSWIPGTLDITWHSSAQPKQWSLAPGVIRFGKEDGNKIIRI